jgi:hypothetical protein
LFSGIESAIDLNNPKDEKDFEVLGQTLAAKLTVHEVRKYQHSLIESEKSSLQSNDKILFESSHQKYEIR